MSFRTKGQDDMEIKNICTFVKAAELGNFTKAAQELGYAQSTVTAQIQQLENELHVNLFERNGKRIVLSASGKEFLQYAYQIIKYESMAVEHFFFVRRTRRGIEHRYYGNNMRFRVR